MSEQEIRNVALVAHVDHGKTTLVDAILRHCGALGRGVEGERLLDRDAQERERGITILAKATGVRWRGRRIHLVDTPGHADFGGEVERVLSMVDAVLLLVDAVEGPMPQTRFVTRKALARGLAPIVVVNKMDRAGARPAAVVDAVFDLLCELGASEAQLDFPVVYCSGVEGWASLDPDRRGADLEPLLETLVAHTPPPRTGEGPFRMQVSLLDYSSYVGVIGIGRVERGRLRRNRPVVAVDREGRRREARVLEIHGFEGLERVPREEAVAGDIVAVVGVEEVAVSDTLCDPGAVEPLPPLAVDEPTVAVHFEVNTSPFAGRDGRYLTSRQLRERLEREALHNVALRVEPTAHPDRFRVAGRGELHLAVLIENMRREGYELAVSRPEVVLREIDGVLCEPWERLVLDLPAAGQGAVMEELGRRRGELVDMRPEGAGRVRLEYRIPTRGLFGLRTELLTLTAGEGILHAVFDGYGPRLPGEVARRPRGAMIANATGKALAYALFNLQERGRLFIGPGEAVYEGMVIGLHSRPGDLVVNPLRAKKLTNIRAAANDENILLTPPLRLTLERALELVGDDELVEVTPAAIRLRKRHLDEAERRRAGRRSAAG
ncbi:translational GTPase TypA [Inmirania thermothiophila]|uniref:Large ribosomal subunit assembly factor BipA n=1 Tax=Inmirania thermothiophila TaxID=1750597 RepID=A0A3N1YA02_9GAMM|nr:translational GTPase TypA [Inmirania thermothiophila]ROR34452.1 GTP-binding protein [Inmirania thermothiophila]